ncbi:hypothetical protein JTE90_025927 [Oedothorax gibbosus]|uniref:Phospholipid/glycerol acyltransferase domain-containing protein n=1 Tax=Oedothorax gibbosus TaxID=931172 RepID=A0AAV6UAN1_9ARAC|nr:hypothetical protein JTE90_025927 [Oedothorax gibbosus]
MDLQRLIHLGACSLRVCFVTLTNLYCIPTYLLWMWGLLLPFRLLNHPGYWFLEGLMYRWMLSVVATWSWNSGYHIVELGDDVHSLTNDRCLFIVNHQSTADVPFMMLAFQEKPTVLESVMWIMDRMFRYTNFGAVSMTHGDYFITQGKNARDYQMKKLRDHLISAYMGRNRRWIILFPEGGFLSKRLETSVKYATKNNFPVLEHCTLPRIGAMEVILNTLRPGGTYIKELDEEVPLLEGTAEEREPLKWVIDVTVAYPDVSKPIDLLAICATTRPPSTTYMHYRRYPVEEVPVATTDELRDWTYARWTEKEEMLKEYYETGEFPLVPKSQRRSKKCEGFVGGCRCSHVSCTNIKSLVDVSHTGMKSPVGLSHTEIKGPVDGSEVVADHVGDDQGREGNPVVGDCTLNENPADCTAIEDPVVGDCTSNKVEEKNPVECKPKCDERLADGDHIRHENLDCDHERLADRKLNERPVETHQRIKSYPKPHKVLMSTGKILFLHTFFISSTLFHYYLLRRFWNFARY